MLDVCLLFDGRLRPARRALKVRPSLNGIFHGLYRLRSDSRVMLVAITEHGALSRSGHEWPISLHAEELGGRKRSVGAQAVGDAVAVSVVDSGEIGLPDAALEIGGGEDMIDT